MRRDRTCHIEAIQIHIVYNNYRDYAPNGLLYVPKKDTERIKRETLRRFEMDISQPYKEVRPLVIRNNSGDTAKSWFRTADCRFMYGSFLMLSIPRKEPVLDTIMTVPQVGKFGMLI